MKILTWRQWLAAIAVVALLATAAVTLMSARDRDAAPQPVSRGRDATVTVARREFVRSIRLNGTIEAVQATTIAAPRLAGPNSNSLVITKLIKGGTKVAPGDVLVAFDRQLQLQTALDRRA